MKKLKIAVIGAGSTYTPELVNGFIARKDALSVSSFRFMDIDKGKAEITAGLAGRMLAANGLNNTVSVTESLDRALDGADYVIGQIRAGGLDARINDEKIPLKYGLLGQETTGAGGFMNALRTIPAMMEIAKRIERLAPEAWLINFSNPSGIVVEALANNTGVKIIGLCNAPIKMVLDAKERVPENTRVFDYDFVGLNHLCWISAIYADGEEILSKQLASDPTNGGYKHSVYNVSNAALARATGGLPSGYLNYYYYRDEQLRKCMEAERSRGEECKEIERELLESYKDPGLCKKPDALDKRGGAMYSDAAVSLIDAIENDKREYHVVGVKNGGALPFLAHDDAVEIKCVVGRNGAVPVKIPRFDNQYIVGLVQAVKAYEKLTVRAALSGCRDTALAALMVHPLIGDFEKAKGVLDEMLSVNREFLPGFFTRGNGA